MARKRKLLGEHPLDTVIPGTPGPQESQETQAPGKPRKFTVEIDPDLLHRLRNVAWGDRVTLGSLIEDALRPHLADLEKRRGRPYAERPNPLKPGRPVSS